MTDRDSILQGFSACPLCGHLMATLSALAGGDNLDSAIEKRKGPWLEYVWQPAFAEALVRYYDLHFEPDVEWYSGQCPLCRRRIIYQRQEDGASLRIECLPGSRRMGARSPGRLP